MVVPIMFALKEPDSWLKAKAAAAAGALPKRNIGSPVELFRDPRWRRNTIVGLFLGVSGMIGLWGIGFFSPELISTALKGEPQDVVDRVRGLGTALQDVGSFFGMVTFTLVASFLSRRLAFLGALLLSMVVTMFVFTSLHTASDAYWMLPMMGFAQLAVFAGYSIYFPELFPDAAAWHGRGLLLQHRPLPRRAGADPLRLARHGDDLPQRRRAHVHGVPRRRRGAHLGAGDQGQAAAGGLDFAVSFQLVAFSWTSTQGHAFGAGASAFRRNGET